MQFKNTYSNKNKLLVAAAVILILMVWTLSIRPLISVISLNTALRNQLSATANLAHNPEYMAGRNRDMEVIIEKYKVDTSVWRNDLWLKLSELASQKNVDIFYKPELDDSSNINPSFLYQEISFEGDFIKLVSFLDSAQKLRGIGCISHMSMIRKKDDSSLSMVLTFFALPE